MKYFFVCLFASCFFINKLLAIDTISYINNKGEISVSNNYVDTLWTNTKLSHSSSSYIEKYNMTINMSNGYYLVRLYRNITKEDVNIDIATFGDVFYDKITFEYYNINGVKNNESTYYNDGVWFKYNYWSFAPYSDNPWTESNDLTAYEVKMSNDCSALILRGQRDSIDPPLMSVFLLYGGEVKLVYNKKVEINAVSSNTSRTTFDIQKIIYDADDKLIPNQNRIIFENKSVLFE